MGGCCSGGIYNHLHTSPYKLYVPPKAVLSSRLSDVGRREFTHIYTWAVESLHSPRRLVSQSIRRTLFGSNVLPPTNTDIASSHSPQKSWPPDALRLLCGEHVHSSTDIYAVKLPFFRDDCMSTRSAEATWGLYSHLQTSPPRNLPSFLNAMISSHALDVVRAKIYNQLQTNTREIEHPPRRLVFQSFCDSCKMNHAKNRAS